VNHTQANDFSGKVRDSARGHEITRVLQSMNGGDRQGAAELLDLVYDELRAMARRRMRQEPGGGAGMTLDATALVHEAYLRVAGNDGPSGQPDWENRSHFFGAAALAMRRILVEQARHRKRLKHGGGKERVDLDVERFSAEKPQHDQTDLLALDEALTYLEQIDARKARIVSLRYFGGLSIDETAAAMDLSPATIKNEWAFARAWLHRQLIGDDQ
jgi:RNA polymerase sigma factor (TIGR02999 family)